MGNLYKSDIDRLFVNQIKEASSLRGTTVKFFETLTETKNIYTDIEVTHLPNSVDVDIIFETYPQNRKTLQRTGWYNKDSENNPATAFVPVDLEILRRWQFVLLPGRIVEDGIASGWRTYHVTKIDTTMEHPFYYIIALAPVFTDNAPIIDRDENFNFIKTDGLFD